MYTIQAPWLRYVLASLGFEFYFIPWGGNSLTAVYGALMSCYYRVLYGQSG